MESKKYVTNLIQALDQLGVGKAEVQTQIAALLDEKRGLTSSEKALRRLLAASSAGQKALAEFDAKAGAGSDTTQSAPGQLGAAAASRS